MICAVGSAMCITGPGSGTVLPSFHGRTPCGSSLDRLSRCVRIHTFSLRFTRIPLRGSESPCVGASSPGLPNCSTEGKGLILRRVTLLLLHARQALDSRPPLPANTAAAIVRGETVTVAGGLLATTTITGPLYLPRK